MRFWDTSAIVPLAVEERGSDLVRAWLPEDAEVAIWGMTPLECASAIERRVREGAVPRQQRQPLLGWFQRFSSAASEVTDVMSVRIRAVQLVARHALRAADAAQLGAALLVAESDPSSLTIVCLDRGLADAAAREGFAVLTWPEDAPVRR